MFSPSSRKWKRRSWKEEEEESASPCSSSIPKRASSPWRVSEAVDTDPVRVGQFPQQVRDAQAQFLHTCDGEAGVSGGTDRATSLCWIVFDDQLFIWPYLSPSPFSSSCKLLQIPPSLSPSTNHDAWMLGFINWNQNSTSTSTSIGVLLCNKISQALVYWPDIFSETPPLVHPPIPASASSSPSSFNSFIVSPIPASASSTHACLAIAIAASSHPHLSKFLCTPSTIVPQTFSLQGPQPKGYPRSLIWHFQHLSSHAKSRQFLLLTNSEIQCYTLSLALDSTPNLNLTNLWSHQIVGTDNDLGIKKDLAGQKQIWPLDMQIDDRGKEITILVATFCKDRLTTSSYTQYSLLTMHYKPGLPLSPANNDNFHERVLEKKAPIQVIIPKARVEDENFFFSMRLRVGGKPSGSVIILSGDGTATVSNYWRNGTRLYQFDLPHDASKVLDASVFSPTKDGEEGSWVVLTEKAGLWAIPEKAVLFGAVEPPERSLSRKGSSNEGASEEEKRSLAFGRNIAPRRANSEAWDAGDRQRVVLTATAHRTAQNEESEALLARLFHDFLLSGQVNDSLEKLRTSGAFEKDNETNVFTRMSKSIVDTLAKHWTTTRGAEVVAMTVVSSQLSDKQQKHQKFLQFLAFSKCHEELSSKQRHSLQTIMEHGEKLAGVIQLRELQSTLTENRPNGTGISYEDSLDEMPGSLWDLIQIVGEKARRNTVLLMDRDNAEVFYSKISDIEEIFGCLSHQLQNIIAGAQPLIVQIKQACELSNACVVLLRAAMQYRNDHETWYPTPEGITSWSSQPVVRNGLWCIASLMLQLFIESANWKEKSHLYSHLEQLTDVLLELYTGAITGKVERQEDHRGILDEYMDRRDVLLSSLYQHTKDFVDHEYQPLAEGVEQSKEDNLRKITLPLLSIARRHEGYKTMWSICCDLNDYVLLQNLMLDSVGPKRGFSQFVFEQMYENRQFAKIIRLGEEFQEELTIFLRQHKDLLWLHEVFLNKFSFASESLHELALSQEHATLATEGDSLSRPMRRGLSLTDRKRLLNLSKIAAMAGKDDDHRLRTKRIEADLKILNLQQEIMELLPGHNDREDIGLLPVEELIKICLGSSSPEVSLRAFEVFAWTSSSFHESNRGLLEECWKHSANQNDWGRLYQDSITQGWSDKEAIENLRGTVLFQASERCYGPLAKTYDGAFDEVLPLRQDDDVDGSSVERILMQHKDFPDAGKLMLTAIMFGKVGAESFTPME